MAKYSNIRTQDHAKATQFILSLSILTLLTNSTIERPHTQNQGEFEFNPALILRRTERDTLARIEARAHAKKPEKKVPNCQKPYSGYVHLTGCDVCYKYFFKTETLPGHFTCKKCPQGCLHCENELSCLLCAENYYLEPGQSGKCSQCLPNCKDCQTRDSCQSCSSGFYLTQERLTKKVECQSCVKGCEICSNSTKCEKCGHGYFLEVGECLPCSSHCRTCTSAEVCTSCLGKFEIGLNSRCESPGGMKLFGRSLGKLIMILGVIFIIIMVVGCLGTYIYGEFWSKGQEGAQRKQKYIEMADEPIRSSNYQ